ncbi:MAG: NrtA/SsuA/CpmA family ABC transporter substrate-binding protein [Pseudomonadota bacterium]
MISSLHRRVRSLVSVATTVAAVALAATPTFADEMGATLALNLSPISGIAIVAKEKGFFEAEGLDITQSNFTSGKQALNAVLGGAAEIATTAEAPTTAAAMAKQPIAFLARMEYSDLKTLTATGSEITVMDDIAGKRLAFTAGTGSEVYTMALLAKAGLTPDDVQLVNLRPQDMLPALVTGDIDAYNTWEPHISNGIKTLGEKVAPLDTSGVYSETFNIVVMQEYLEENPELITAFLTALIAAEGWMAENPDEAIDVVATAVGMPVEDLAAIWNDYVFEVVLDQRQMDVLTAHAQWRLDSGNHPPGAEMPDFMDVVFPEPLRAIDPERVKAPF